MAATSIIKVLSGRWKLVISASTHLNLYGGYMNIEVLPRQGSMVPSFFTALSKVRTEVVPTAITLLHLRLARLIISAALSFTS